MALAATTAFAYYVGQFGSYTATYGALGGVIVLLLWLFITGYVLVLGAALNAVIDQQVGPDRVRQRRQQKKAEAGRKHQPSPDHRPSRPQRAQAPADAAPPARSDRAA